MADRFYGLNRGANYSTEVSEDSSSPSKGVEVCVDLAVGLEKHEVLKLLQQIMDHIAMDQWPPA